MDRLAGMGGSAWRRNGAGTHPGAGVPGVVNSAKATAGLVARDVARGDYRGTPQEPSR